MKTFILSTILTLSTSLGFSQGKVISVLNDSTELQQFDDGQQLKVSYLLNGTAISIKEKDNLVATVTNVHQEFNIKTSCKEIVGEINLLVPDYELPKKEEVRPKRIYPKTVDLLKDLKGTLFPAFSWTGINGNKLSLDELKGKTIVLNFWHTSCIPCIAEMPLLNELVKQYAGKEVVFIASTPDNNAGLQKFLGRTRFAYNQVAEVEPRMIFDPFPGWPIHIVLNGNGIIKFHAIGKQKDIEQKLVRSIDEALAENK
jgi:thiol-disulfide isomerase/thioredoxin